MLQYRTAALPALKLRKFYSIMYNSRMGSGKGRARRAQSSHTSNDVADALGGFSDDLQRVIDNFVPDEAKEGLTEALSEIRDGELKKGIDGLRAGEYDAQIEGLGALKNLVVG